MKEKDLENNLDNLIINGLIKEAEQDNADFEAAMRQMGHEEFMALIGVPEEPMFAAFSNSDMMLDCGDDSDEEPVAASRLPEPAERTESALRTKPAAESRWKMLIPWIAATVAAAAVVAIVLVPSLNAINGRLCDSALYASTEYITSSRSASDVSGLSDRELKAKLPELEARYETWRADYRHSSNATDELQEAGWELTVAYLRLHRKGDAVKVLRVLAGAYADTPFGGHCAEMVRQLE